MVEAIKLYLLGFLLGTSGVNDPNAIQIAKAQSEQPTVIVRMPVHNSYSTCLYSAKKQFAQCTTKTDKVVKKHTKSATSIFKKQRKCILEKEHNQSRCKIIFLK
jgi:hypothetical protein